ncbi:hypothetical protein Tco_1148161 [Tanacetum coccineum]
MSLSSCNPAPLCYRRIELLARLVTSLATSTQRNGSSNSSTRTLEGLHAELSVSSLQKKFEALNVLTRKVGELTAIMFARFAEILRKEGKDERVKELVAQLMKPHSNG